MNCKANILLLSILCIFSTSCNNRGASTPQQINSSLFVGYEKLIGKSFLDISELDTNLHWSEGSVLPEADQYSMSRFSINNKNNIDLIFLIQQVEDRNKILDILTIDEKTFSQEVTIYLGQCNCKEMISCNTVSVLPSSYYSSDEAIHPIKVWIPDVKIKKFIQVDTLRISCKEMEQG